MNVLIVISAVIDLMIVALFAGSTFVMWRLTLRALKDSKNQQKSTQLALWMILLSWQASMFAMFLLYLQIL